MRSQFFEHLLRPEERSFRFLRRILVLFPFRLSGRFLRPRCLWNQALVRENWFGACGVLALSDDGACWIAHDTVLVEGLVVAIVIVDEPVIVHPGDVVAIEVHYSMIF